MSWLLDTNICIAWLERENATLVTRNLNELRRIAGLKLEKW